MCKTDEVDCMQDTLTTAEITTLIRHAEGARENAYAPYSGYQVGAALLTKDGAIVQGCNVENASYGVTNCAERTAFFSAVSSGKRGFKAIAIVGGKGDSLDLAYPCGVCRQVMMEFCNPKTFVIIVAKSENEYTLNTLEQLLPNGFGPANLESESL